MEHLHNAHRRQTLPLGIGMMEIMELFEITVINKEEFINEQIAINFGRV